MQIPLPLLPEIESAYGWLIGAGGLVVGAALLLWGSKLSRLITAIAGAGGGLAVAQQVIDRSDMDPLAVRIGIACGCAIFGFILARLIWAILLATLAAGVAGVIVLWRYLPEVEQKAQPVFKSTINAQQWAAESVQYSQASGEAMLDFNFAALLLVMIPAFMLPLIMFLLLPRLGKILATAIAGGVAIIAGLVLAGSTARESLWPSEWQSWAIVGAIAGGLTLVGIVLQYIITRAKGEDEEEEDGDSPAKKHKSKKSRKTEEE